MLLLSLSACGRTADPTADGAPAAPDTLTVELGAPDQTFVFRCSGPGGDDFAFSMRTRAGALALWLPPRFSLPYLELGRVPTASGARYEAGGVTVWNKGEQALLSVDEEAFGGCTLDRGASVWEHAKLSGVDLRAVGNEPGWYLEMRRDLETRVGQRIHFVYDYGRREAMLIPLEETRDTVAMRTVFEGRTNDDQPFRVVLESAPCHDSMSGEPFETRVAVELDGSTYRGCGRPLH